MACFSALMVILIFFAFSLRDGLDFPINIGIIFCMGTLIHTIRLGASEEDILGSYGPVNEETATYFPWETRLDPTQEQELEAGVCYGPHMASMNASRIFETLGYRFTGGETFDAHELLERIQAGYSTDGDLHHEYIDHQYAGMAHVCQQAIQWNSAVLTS